MRTFNQGLYRKLIDNPKWKDGDPYWEKTKWVDNPKMKIRILSDLHVDYNYKNPLKLIDKDTFTIISGDISGYTDSRDRWLKENINNGLFVEGNHIFYNNENKTLQDHYASLREKYPLESDLSFLQNNHKIINDIVFVGATLWTDCRFYGYRATNELPRKMNDYRYGLYNDENGQARIFTPNDSIHEFEKSLKYISEICDKYESRKVVVITHHCPSAKCISPNYRKSSECNQAYASNLEDFIKNHGNIVAWICGHSHHQADFKIDGCRIVMNCRGYVSYHEDEKFNPYKTILI